MADHVREKKVTHCKNKIVKITHWFSVARTLKLLEVVLLKHDQEDK